VSLRNNYFSRGTGSHPDAGFNTCAAYRFGFDLEVVLSLGDCPIDYIGGCSYSRKGDDYIRESIVDPSAVIVDGFSNLTPKTFASLKESGIEDLIGYLKTLN
jgi:hypothetical protein